MANLILPSRKITQPNAPTALLPEFSPGVFINPAVRSADELYQFEAGGGFLPTCDGIGYQPIVTNTYGYTCSKPQDINPLAYSVIIQLKGLFYLTSTSIVSCYQAGEGMSLALVSTGYSPIGEAEAKVTVTHLGIADYVFSTVLPKRPIDGITVLVTYKNGSLKVFSEGFLVETKTGTSYIPTLSIPLRTGAPDYNNGFRGAITLAAQIPWVDDTVAKSISANPWQIFAPQKRIIYFDAGAGGGTVSISSAALSVATSTGELSTSLDISGSSASIASIAGTPTFTINLSASALSQSLASGLLSQGLSISGDMSAQSTVSGNVSQDVFIEGSATGQSAASGQIGIQLNIAGSSISEAFASGVISGGSVSSISGAASGVSAASGSVELNIPIAGNASAQSNISGSVGVNIPVSGVSASVSSITGALTIDGLIYIDGSALSNAQSSGLISLTIPLSGAALAVAYASGIAMPDVINADYACLHGTVSRLTMIETSVNHLTNLTTRVNYVARC